MSMRIVNVTLPSAHFNGESTLPSLYEMTNVQALTRSALDEDDGLFIGYGGLRSLFPYRMQDLYDRAEEPTVYVGIEFENRYLKALFLPALGGRLWSLYDKVAGRELLYRNPVVRPCNLAVRNAWLAGGIEFNCGMIGHHPFTCSQIFAAQTALDDGTPVLRMYEFERIRRCVYQMDFFLPEESRVLLGRMRIVNPNRETVPMYWWTNMAVRENPRARNVIDATVSYNNKGGIVGKNPVPVSGGTDITYPSRNPVAIDYFWKIPDAARKFTAYLDENGIEYVEHTGSTADEVTLAAQAMVADGVDAVFTPTDNSIMKAELAIYETFIDAGIPQYTGADSFALNGAFLGYGVDYANLGRETADMIADILLRGAAPASTPVRTFDNGTAAVNTETCAALGLDFDTISAAFAPYCTKITTLTTAESFS